MLVSQPGEHAGLADVDGYRGVPGVDIMLLRAQAQTGQEDRYCQERGSPHGTPLNRNFRKGLSHQLQGEAPVPLATH